MDHFEQDAHPSGRLRHSAVYGAFPGTGDDGASPHCSSTFMDRCGLCSALRPRLSICQFSASSRPPPTKHEVHGTYRHLDESTTQITCVCIMWERGIASRINMDWEGQSVTFTKSAAVWLEYASEAALSIVASPTHLAFSGCGNPGQIRNRTGPVSLFFKRGSCPDQRYVP
ncbi:hypothetical protein LX36DRAFT_260025 [Colletotrichum falcatum]|nr:hypothetical protein LX36DRAFT_260025 [Colletotrichum falcatum]